MSISRVAVHRPVLTAMIALIVVILGLTALVHIPVDLMPDISYPTLTISTSYSNTGPEIIEQLITRPVEQAMGAVPGVEEIYSTSSEGSSRVRLSFAWGTDLEAATNDVRDRLDRVIPRLPSDAERPRLFKFDATAMPIMAIGASGAFDLQSLRQILDEQVVYRLERVDGVAAVDIWGGTQRQVHVELDAQQLRSLQIPVEQIVSRVNSANVELPVGTVTRGNFEVNVRTSGLYGSLEDLRGTSVAVRDGAPVRLGQVAEVKDGWQEVSRIARINGQPAVQLAISKQSGKNTVEVARDVRREIERINQDLPQIKLAVLRDSSQYIRYAIGNVGSSALFGGMIALLVLLFFLRSLGSTAVIAVSIPLSIIATFALIYFSRFTLNMMSLGGLALGVGMLVDNSVVVLENIYRLREAGEEAHEAAVKGSLEVTSAVVASTLTTLVVFLPLIFLSGMAGIMYKQLALVVSFALACSLLAALTLVPMLSARLVRIAGDGDGRRPRGAPYRLIGRLLAGLEERYRALLHFTLDHRVPVLGAVALLLVGSLLLVPLVGNELMPSTDEGQVRLSVSMDRGTRLEITDQKFREAIEPIVLQAVPEAQAVFTTVGSGGWGGGTGQVSVTLKPKAERGRSDAQIAADLRRKLMAVPGVLIRVRTSQGLFMMPGGSSGTDQVEVEIRGYDLAMADQLAAQVQAALESIEGITDVSLSRESGSPEEHLVVDRRRAADLGVTPQQVSSILQTVISGATAGTFRQGGNEYPIVVRLREADRMSLEELLALPVVTGEGRSVLLGSLVRAQPRTGPSRIERRDQERIISVEANISGRKMGAVMQDVRRLIRTIPVPPNFSILPSGSYLEQQKANRELLVSILLAVVLVYMVMAAQFESLRDPFIVLFAVPLAVIGVVLMLLATGTTFNIQSGIGALMLGGIVVNNAILLVDQTNLLRRRDRLPLRQAIEEAGRRRLRPILMTALTTTFALIPLALGLGEGGELQAPLARTVIGGLLSSSFITLLVVPTVYFILEQRRGRRHERRRGVSAAALPLLVLTAGLLALPPRAAAQGSGPAPQEPLPLSVGEAVLMALENNASLKVQRLAPSIRQTYEKEAQAAFGLRAESSAGASVGFAEGEAASAASASAGLSVDLPSGTSAGLELSVEPATTGGYAAGLGLGVTQAVLQGAGSRVNLAQVRQARLDTFASRWELKGLTESLVANTERTYWDLFLARQQEGIYRESLRLAEQHLQDTRTRIQVGRLAEIELAAAQAEAALRRSDLVDAQARVEKTRLQLLRLINPPAEGLWDRPLDLRDRPLLPEEALENPAEHVQTGQRLRSDLNQARLAAQRGELEVVRTRNGLLPRLDLFIGLGMSGYADSFTGALAELPADAPALSGALSFSYPYPSGTRTAKARLERAAAGRAQAAESVRNLEQLVEVDVRSAWIEAARTREQVDDTAATRALQEEKLRAEEEKYQVGRSTAYLVAQAQRDLLAAQLREAQAVVDHLKARIDLYRLEGSLLQRRGLEIPDLPSS